MDAAEIEQLLFRAAQTQAIALGFRFGPGADSDVHARARSAAALITALSPVQDDQDAALERAVRSFRLFADTMVGVRREAYRGNAALLQSNIIGEDTFRLAEMQLCPGFWPFC